MLDKNTDFEIVPIFNQRARRVWADFINIETTCDKVLFGIRGNEIDKNYKLDVYKNNLICCKHNFAFGAYHNNQMVGFISGFQDWPDLIYVAHLYVLPQYHKYGLGTRLLKATEQMSGIVSSKIRLVALASSESFYEKNGYSKIEFMEKDVSPVVNSIIPVFQWIKKDFKVKCALPVDTMLLRKIKYQPVFVHVNESYKIDGVGLKTVNGKDKIWIKHNSIVHNELLNALSKTK